MASERLLLRLGVLGRFLADAGVRCRRRLQAEIAAHLARLGLPRRIDSAISSSVSTSRASPISSIVRRTSVSSPDLTSSRCRCTRSPRRRRSCHGTASALMGDGHLDFHQMGPHSARNPSAAPRAGRSRRGNLQPIGAIDGIGDIEHGRQRPRDRLAILELHRAVRPLGHDLHCAAGFPGNADPHQAITHALEHRRRDRGYPCRHARLDDEPRLGQQLGIRGTSGRFGHIQGQGARWLRLGYDCKARFGTFPTTRQAVSSAKPRSGNKKERVLSGHTLTTRIV